MTTYFLPDIIIAVLIIVSIAISLVRGFVKELISVISWVVAAWLAIRFSKELSAYITFTDVQSLRVFLAFLTVFVTCIFLGAMVNFVIGQFVKQTPFSTPDKLLGMLFGLARGALVISILVLLGGLTAFPKDNWWKESYSIKYFEKAAIWMQGFLPAEVSQHFNFEPVEGAAKPAAKPAEQPVQAPVENVTEQPKQ